MVKRLRRNPLKVESRVRFSLGSPNEKLPATNLLISQIKIRKKRVFSFKNTEKTIEFAFTYEFEGALRFRKYLII